MFTNEIKDGREAPEKHSSVNSVPVLIFFGLKILASTKHYDFFVSPIKIFNFGNDSNTSNLFYSSKLHVLLLC